VLLACALCLAALSACKDEADTPAAPAQTAQPPAAQAAAVPPVELKDIIETNSRFIIGISYPPAASKYPALAADMQRFAEVARQDLMKAVAEADPNKQSAPFDLTLNFSLLTENPQMVAVAADGSSFLGGAHSVPIIARFVWLPQANKMLRADALFSDPSSWGPISEYVREQLHATLSQRIDADELPPEQRAELMRSIGKTIDSGTEPKPFAYRWFEPVLAPGDDKIVALRFVFPPYQVGPYVDGTRSVEVPAEILMPHLAPEFQPMFSTEPAPTVSPIALPPSGAPPELEAPASGG
jgi:hypothetical protein